MVHLLVSAQEALETLSQGNSRYVSGETVNQQPDLELRGKLVEGQDPSVIILTCIDSRVDPVKIFDLKAGEAFTPQTIGNTADKTEDEAVWYAVNACNIRLVVVMGHQSCGAVQHAIKGERIGQCIDGVVDAIQPAVDSAASMDGDMVENTVKQNALNVARRFAEHPDFKELVESGELKIVPAYYHLDTGKVDFLE